MEGGGLGRGRGVGGGAGDQGIFPSTCHILHYHIVLRPEGTSHNNISIQNLDIESSSV